MQLTINLNASEQFLRDILATACEGGSNYWAGFRCTRKHMGPHGAEWAAVRVAEYGDNDKPTFHNIGPTELVKGMGTLLTANVGDRLDNGSIRESHFTINGTTRSNVFSALLADDAGNLDADDCDAILQYACFGGIIYG